MVNERRLARLTEQIRQHVAKIIAQELADPRLGFVTVSRVVLDRELVSCKVYWSCLGDEKARKLSDQALQRARGFVQRQVAHGLHTRTAPHLEFVYDASIAGAIRLQNLIDSATAEDRQHQVDRGEAPGSGAAPDTDLEPGERLDDDEP